MKLLLLRERFGIFRFEPGSEVPPAVWRSRFVSVTRTDDELSIVCEQDLVADADRSDGPWSCFAVGGPLAFSQTGVLLSLAEPLARAGVSLFAVSTYDTDYVLVGSRQLREAVVALRGAGHEVSSEPGREA